MERLSRLRVRRSGGDADMTWVQTGLQLLHLRSLSKLESAGKLEQSLNFLILAGVSPGWQEVEAAVFMCVVKLTIRQMFGIEMGCSSSSCSTSSLCSVYFSQSAFSLKWGQMCTRAREL